MEQKKVVREEEERTECQGVSMSVRRNLGGGIKNMTNEGIWNQPNQSQRETASAYIVIK